LIERTDKTRNLVFACMVLAGVVVGLFWPLGHNPFINLDDPEYVTQNPHVLAGLSWANVAWAFTSGYAANWHPLTWLSHMLDIQLFGLDPGWHHVTNLAFHVANTLLLFLVLHRLTGAFWRSFCVAALFGWHPLHIESVAWIAERKDLLSGFFFLLTLWAYARYVECRAGSAECRLGTVGAASGAETKSANGPAFGRGSGGRVGVWYAAAMVLFALGLMSKPMLVTVPFLLLLVDYWPLARFELKDRKLKPYLPFLVEKIPFLVLAIGSSIVTFMVQDRGEAVGSVESLPLGPRVANALLSYTKYLAKTIWPVDLAVFYPHPFLHYPSSDPLLTWPIVLAALVLAALTISVLLRIRSEPFLATGWFWFIGMLVPVIGLVQVGSQGMADRYTYLPLIGLFICLIWQVADLLKGRRLAVPILATSAGVVLVATAGMTWRQVGYWRDDVALFSRALEVTSDNAQAHFNLATALGRQGRYDEAIAHLRSAIKITPAYTSAHYNLGMALMSQGNLEEAAQAYETALRLRPDYLAAHQNLGVVLLALGKSEAAREQFLEAVRLDPASAVTRCNLGLALTAEGKPADAARQFTEALRLQPGYLDALDGLGRAFAMQRKWDQAETQFRDLLRLCPTNAEIQVALGTTLVEAGRTNEAVRCFDEAVRLVPDLPRQFLKSGKTLLSQGQVPAAQARLTVATRLQPDNPDAQEQLGLACAQLGQIDAAVAHLQTAIHLRPTAEAHYYLGLARVIQHRSNEALTNYQEAVRLKPDWPVALNDLAWLLATDPDPAQRNGTEAVRLAKKACELSHGKEARYWGTLDAAYAETGQFADAIATAEKTRQLAMAAGQNDLAKAAEERLALYKENKPFRLRR